MRLIPIDGPFADHLLSIGRFPRSEQTHYSQQSIDFTGNFGGR